MAALGGISPERFQQLSQNFAYLSGTIDLTNLPDMTSLATSGRLHKATKYCAKVRKTGPAGQTVE